MSKFTVFATIFVLYACAVALGLGDPSSSNLGGGLPGVVSPKNVRILSPAATRLYRMIRKGVSFRVGRVFIKNFEENAEIMIYF